MSEQNEQVSTVRVVASHSKTEATYRNDCANCGSELEYAQSSVRQLEYSASGHLERDPGVICPKCQAYVWQRAARAVTTQSNNTEGAGARGPSVVGPFRYGVTFSPAVNLADDDCPHPDPPADGNAWRLVSAACVPVLSRPSLTEAGVMRHEVSFLWTWERVVAPQ